MANELIFSGDPASQSGLTVTAKVYTSVFVQQGSTVSLTEVASLAGYLGDMPAAPAGSYIVRYFSGASLLGQESIEWNGSAISTPNLTQQNVRDAMKLAHSDGAPSIDVQLINLTVLRR